MKKLLIGVLIFAAGVAGGIALLGLGGPGVRSLAGKLGIHFAADAATGGSASPAGGEKKVLYWKSTMVPGEIKQQPGKDSMGMDMVPVHEGEAASSGGGVKIDPVMLQSLGVRLAPVRRGPLVRRVRTVGYVDYNEPRTAFVSPKVSGWIEKIEVDTTGQVVHKGDPLFEIYSPDLYATQAEYVLGLERVRRAGAGPDREAAQSLLEQTRTRLRLYDVPEDQIQKIEAAGKPERSLTIRSPIDGIVTHKMAFLGTHFDAGTRLYTISDIGTVWVFAEVYERDLPFVEVGQEASMRLSYLPGRAFVGRVTYVYPYVDPKTRTVRVRMEFHNPGYFLKPGMYADVELVTTAVPDAVLVPQSCVLRSGERATVFVWEGEGRFRPTQVKVGLTGDGDVFQIRSGLAGGEQIALSGQFLIDSESQLEEAIRSMLEPPPLPGAGKPDEHAGHDGQGMEGMAGMQGMTMPATATPTAAPPTPTAAPAAAALRYVCPMPEHQGLLYDDPGNCPLCRMELVPFRPGTGPPAPPQGPPLYWTCPMPEHADVRASGPGQCPRCAMTLIPVHGPAPEAAPEPAVPAAPAGAPHKR